ncbi:Ig-like domain-containing protein [Pasteurella sp. PK-2025]|uniref:Ig-like domain-containing protein n=2 Tax=unclassified Pasteurella TaxID=2621516 RepID=UPI003C78E94F
MANYFLRMTQNEQTKTLTFTSKNPLILNADPNTQYEVLDAFGNVVVPAQTAFKNKDLLMYVGQMKTPSVILKEYRTLYPHQHRSYIKQLENEFAIAEPIEISSDTVHTVLASEITTSANSSVGVVVKPTYADKADNAPVLAVRKENAPLAEQVVEVIPVKPTQPEQPQPEPEQPQPEPEQPQPEPEQPQPEPEQPQPEPEQPQPEPEQPQPEPEQPQPEPEQPQPEPEQPQPEPEKPQPEPEKPQPEPEQPQPEPEQPQPEPEQSQPEPEKPVVTPTQLQVSIDTIANNDVINAQHATQTLTISGTLKADRPIESGQVNVIINGVSYPAQLSDNHQQFSVQIEGTAFAQGTQVDVQAQVNAGDALGRADAQRTYHYDATLPTADITIHPIADNDVVNFTASNTNQTLSGDLTLPADVNKENVKVFVVIGEQKIPASLTETGWQANVEGSLLSHAEGQQRVKVQVELTDNAGNQNISETDRTYHVDTQLDPSIIEINPITQDNVINAIEAQAQTINVSGYVKNTLPNANAKAGDRIVLRVGEAEFTGILTETEGELGFNVAVNTIALVNHQSIHATLTTHDEAKNQATANQDHEYHVNTTLAAPTIRFDHVTTDNVINQQEASTEVTLTGHFDVAETVKAGSVNILLTFGEETKVATVDESSKTWSLTVPANLLATQSGDQQFSATISVEDQVGNQASHTSQHAYQVDLDIDKPVITINTIAGDDVLSPNEAEGNITVTGRVDNAFDGQEIRISCGCLTCTGTQWIDLTTKVSDGQFSVNFIGAELKALGPGSAVIRANYTATDPAGNTSSADETLRQFTIENEKDNVAFVIDPVTGDGIINIEEAKQNTITVSGRMLETLPGHRVTNVKMQIGDWIAPVRIPKQRWDKTFSLDVPQEVLEKSSEIKLHVALLTPTGERLLITSQDGTSSLPAKYRYDDTPPQFSVSIDPINQGNTFNMADRGNMTTLSGRVVFDENDIKADSVRVEVTINDKVYPATVDMASKTWSLPMAIDALTLAQGTQNIHAKVFGKDIADNAGESESTLGTYQVDTVAPQPEIHLQIGENNSIDQTSQEDVVIKGQMKGEFRTGEQVTLSINGQTHLATIQPDGSFSLSVSAAALRQSLPLSIEAHYETLDDAGNLGSVNTQQPYSLSQGDIHIHLNPITPDDFINVTEAKQALQISGKISGTEASAQSTVTLQLNGKAIPAQVDADLNFTATVELADFSANTGYTLKAQVEGNHNATAQTNRVYDIAADAIAKIDINQVADNFVVNPATTTRISGVVEFDGIYGTGKNTELLRNVNVKIGEKTYSVGFNGKAKSFFIDIPNDELHALHGKAISIDFKDLATNKPDNFAYSLTQRKDGSYQLNTHTNVTPTVKTLTLTSDAIEKTADNSYQIHKPHADTLIVKGTVSGIAKVGDSIDVTIGEHHYQTVVLEDKTFSLAVSPSHLAQNANKAITATLITQDAAGKTLRVSDMEYYALPHETRGEFVSQHQFIEKNQRKTDHTKEDYNFAYFINGIDAGGRGAGYHAKAPIGGLDEPLVIKYSFMSPEDAKTDTYRPQATGQIDTNSYLEYPERYREFIRDVYKNIAEHVNLRFEESSEPLRMFEGTRFYRAVLKDGMKGASAFAWNGGDLVWNSRWFSDNFMIYTAIHEISHTLQMTHTERGGKPIAGYETEASTEFAAMSYNYNSFIDYRNLRVYDLAFLHYRFGVNKTKRAGNDTYGFKDYNATTTDGGLYIWDGAGIDTFDASNELKGVNVNLTPGSWIYRGTELSKYLIVKDKSQHSKQAYFDLPDDTQIHGKFNGRWDARELLNYTEDQGFIGYGTQIENLIGSDHDDILTGNHADNNIYGGAGDDVIKGGKGNDYLDGGAGNDQLQGELGDDTYVVDSTADKVIELENQGNDSILSHVDYTLPVNVENLTLIGITAKNATGNEGDNTLTANNIGNHLDGAAGNDRLVGGLGEDTLTGGAGQDTFVFNTQLNGNIDTITDFNVGEDIIELSRNVFTALSKGMDNLADYIKYDAESGELSYDSDGHGITDAIHFATLSKNLTLQIDEQSFNIV